MKVKSESEVAQSYPTLSDQQNEIRILSQHRWTKKLSHGHKELDMTEHTHKKV